MVKKATSAYPIRKFNRKPDISIKALQNDYCARKMSIPQIARKYGLQRHAVTRRLRGLGIPMRIPSECHIGQYSRPDVQNADVRYDYCDLKLPIATISKKYGVSSATIRNRMRRMGIAPRDLTRSDISTRDLCHDYLKLKMSTVQIGKKYGVSSSFVGNQLQKAGVQMRLGGTLPIELDAKDLRHNYCTLKLRISDIAKKYNVSRNVITRCLEEMGISMRNRSEAHMGYPTKPHVATKDLKHDYCDLKMSAREVGLKHSISRDTVTHRLKQVGVPMRPAGETYRIKWARLTDEEKTIRIRKTVEASHIKPSQPETIMYELLQSLYPHEWKYVGNKDVILGGLNPDFINVNGQKGIVEVFGDWWHSKAVTGRWKWLEAWSKKRHYAKYGFKTLIIWERELQDMSKVAVKVERFCHSLKGE